MLASLIIIQDSALSSNMRYEDLEAGYEPTLSSAHSLHYRPVTNLFAEVVRALRTQQRKVSPLKLKFACVHKLHRVRKNTS